MMTARRTNVIEIGDVSIELERRGQGRPLLLLHGEDVLEPQAPFVDELARNYEVFIPSPPGFGHSNRPDWITSPDDIAYVFLDLMERLGLDDAVVAGFSLGGWIAAEMATKDDSRFSKLVLVDPYGIKVGGPTDRDIADLWLLTAETVAGLKWFDHAKGARDFSAMSEDELTIIARNNESVVRFCWEPYMHDPKLKHRLHRIKVPTLLLWGEHDGVVSVDYGRAYQRLIPGAQLTIVPNAGHFPHLEQPGAFGQRVAEFLGSAPC